MAKSAIHSIETEAYSRHHSSWRTNASAISHYTVDTGTLCLPKAKVEQKKDYLEIDEPLKPMPKLMQ